MDIEGLDRLLDRLAELATDTRHTEKPLRASGAFLVRSVEQNFQAQGRPNKWMPLSPRTLAGRRKGKGGGSARILIDSAQLKNSMSYRIVHVSAGASVEVGTNVIYAKRQHFGYPGGKGRGRTKTPARPFLMVQPEDTDKISQVFSRHLRGH